MDYLKKWKQKELNYYLNNKDISNLTDYEKYKCIQKYNKLIDKQFEKLQNKVEQKIGSLIKIENIGGDNFLFTGKKGTCKINVIWAGGYDKQKLHTKWLFKT